MENAVVYSLLGIFFTIYFIIVGIMTIVKRFNLDKYFPNLFFMEIVGLCSLWYSISLSFTLYNKFLMQEWEGGFNYPIFLTTAHMLVKFVISRIWAWTNCTNVSVKKSSWPVFLHIIIPIGVLTAVDIVFSNKSIVYLPLSMYTTIKGSALIFTFAWGLAYHIIEFRCNIFVSIVAITVGIGLAVYTTSKLSALGTFFSLVSAAAGGLRWVLLQRLTESISQCKNSMVSLYHFAAPSAVCILPFAVVMEGMALRSSDTMRDSVKCYEAILLALLGGLFSFVLIIVEVKLLNLTSSLTLGVFGQIKEIIQIAMAMMLYHDHIRLVSAFGIAVSIVGSYAYKHYGHVNSSREAAAEGQRRRHMKEHEMVPMIVSVSVVQPELEDDDGY